MQTIIFALLSYFTWGTGILIETVVARRLQSYSLALWVPILSSLALTLYIPFAINDLKALTSGLFLFIIVIGIIGNFIGNVAYYEALNKGNRVLVGTIASSFPVVSILISIIFFHERLSVQQIIAIVVIFIGLTIASLDFKEIRNKNIFADKTILLAFITMLCWGAWIALLKIPVSKIGWFWPNYFTFLLFPLLFLYMWLKRIPVQKPTINNAFIPLIISTALVRIAEFSYNLGISKGLVAIVAPIAGASPTLFVLLAFLFLKDPITKQQIIGIIATLAGILMLSIYSV